MIKCISTIVFVEETEFYRLQESSGFYDDERYTTVAAYVVQLLIMSS